VVVAVSSRQPERAAALARRLPGCKVAPAPECVDAADVVFLTVPDDAIESVAASLAWRHGQATVHCSGAFGLEALEAAVARGAVGGCFHPLQTFASGGNASFQGVTVAIEGEAPRRQAGAAAGRRQAAVPCLGRVRQ
jgi:predicted short-subunit dehydrogenase-like oxidoreductase (DUF2520 family)